MRDVIASLRPQVTFWWGSLIGTILAAVAVVAMFILGIFTLNTSGLVSLDSDKVAMRIQLELEEAGIVATVACPEQVVAPVGFLFVCMVQTPEGYVSQAEVAIVNVLGDINWNLRTELPTSE
jgi:hypothetical protein